MSDGKVKTAKLVGSEPHDVVSLLSASGRDLLVRNKGDQIKVESLKEKKLGLYFFCIVVQYMRTTHPSFS
ncbi:hypothetical protein ACFX2A_038421 [Malus domestica]